MLDEKREYTIAVFPGDGIGAEVTEAGLAVAETVAASKGITLHTEFVEAGAKLYERTGEALPDSALKTAEGGDAILLGAMGMPGIRYPDGREIAPQLDLRTHFELYAGIRPIRSIPGLKGPLQSPKADNIDLVIVRESTEGLFAERHLGEISDDAVARDTLVITRPVSEKLFKFAFDLTATRKSIGSPGRTTCVDKANVLTSMAFFRRIFDETALRYPGLDADHAYVDAAALTFVREPWTFDVLVTENMFGDILSDLAAGVVGGIGVAPSADIGDAAAVFQPCHGTAPDLVGLGRANPIAMILSVEMMFDWLGRTRGDQRCSAAAAEIASSVDMAFLDGKVKPMELGGQSSTEEITAAVIANLDARGGLNQSTNAADEQLG